jgi:hypothetical protein
VTEALVVVVALIAPVILFSMHDQMMKLSSTYTENPKQF